MRLVDANVFIRALTEDVPEMSGPAQDLLERVRTGAEAVEVLESTVAEVVYVLGSRNLYSRTREWISDRLLFVLNLEGLHMEHKSRCQRALSLYAQDRNVSIADALVAFAAMDGPTGEVYSFDHGFDRVAA